MAMKPRRVGTNRKASLRNACNLLVYPVYPAAGDTPARRQVLDQSWKINQGVDPVMEKVFGVFNPERLRKEVQCIRSKLVGGAVRS